MIRSLTLEQLGSRIEMVDEYILMLMAHRMNLSLNVAAYKGSQNPPLPIVRGDKEDERLKKAMEIGKGFGLKPNFAFSMLYFLINESCKEQTIELQGKFTPLPDVKDEELFAFLKQNLLTLTEIVASVYDEQYDGEFFASRQYRNFEESVLSQKIDSLVHKGFAVDLGCATGERTFLLSEKFEHVRGYDLSPHMIDQAKNKLDQHENQNIEFRQVDLETGIPLPDNSVSFVMMNLGTASDISDIERLLKDVERVLIPGGGFLFSFYNADALVYKWDFLPWPLAVAAEVNREKDCLDVHVGKKVFSVPAWSYSLEKVRSLFSSELAIGEILTYPTVGSILPNRLFTTEKVKTAILKIDENLSPLGFGAYAIVTGNKI